jgi:hypothetical protein
LISLHFILKITLDIIIKTSYTLYMMRKQREIDMTKFVNKNFYYNGDYLFYRVPGEEFKRFVARFKRGGMVAFKKFLRENFTVEEYFDLLENKGMAPIQALRTKGYVSPNVRKYLASIRTAA